MNMIFSVCIGIFRQAKQNTTENKKQTRQNIDFIAGIPYHGPSCCLLFIFSFICLFLYYLLKKHIGQTNKQTTKNDAIGKRVFIFIFIFISISIIILLDMTKLKKKEKTGKGICWILVL